MSHSTIRNIDGRGFFLQASDAFMDNIQFEDNGLGIAQILDTFILRNAIIQNPRTTLVVEPDQEMVIENVTFRMR